MDVSHTAMSFLYKQTNQWQVATTCLTITAEFHRVELDAALTLCKWRHKTAALWASKRKFAPCENSKFWKSITNMRIVYSTMLLNGCGSFVLRRAVGTLLDVQSATGPLAVVLSHIM
jgi:hypothetical protein